MSERSYKIEIDSVTDMEWSRLMDRFEDANIYQTWSYGSVRWGAKNLSHLVLKQADEVRGIAQLRIIAPTPARVGIAYLRWGPLCCLRGQELDPAIVNAMAAALREEYVVKRGLYLEVLPNAAAGSRRAEVFQAAFYDFDCKAGIGSYKYRTLFLDLSPSIEELRKKLLIKWRGHLNSAERNSLGVIQGISGEHYHAFSELYAQMWDRKKFETTLNVEEFGRIQEHLPANQRMAIFICEHGERPVAAVVCSAIGHSGIYLLGASNEEGRKLKGSYLLQWAIVRFLKERGVRYYDLGGIDPDANLGVYYFKKGLCGVDVSYIDPFIACENNLSAVFAKAGQVVNKGFHSCRQRLARHEHQKLLSRCQ